MKNLITTVAALATLAFTYQPADACTGITLTAKDGTRILSRTIEWGGSELNSQYVVVPRGYQQQSYIPGGRVDGLRFTARYGYVGLAVEQKEFVAEGLNEAGLSAGLFYFPRYGKYEDYQEANRTTSIADLQLVSWMLANFSTVEEVKAGMKDIHVIAIDPRASTVHWRIEDLSGKQVVIEIVDGKVNFYDNPLGVLTNSPGFEWQMTNLNNYVNLFPGSAEAQQFGDIQLTSFGAGSGFLGIPGDVTPPSRFVRAAFYQTTTPQKETATETVLQCFQIMNNFDIPVGIEFPKGEIHADIPSATQWTSATDLRNGKIYFRTMYNSAIRCIDLKQIDFGKTKYQAVFLDDVKQQPIVPIDIR